MTDWVYENETRNYGIRKKIGINARELCLVLFLVVPITGTLIFHLWVRSEITDTGYKIQELSRLEEALTRTHEKLIVKEEKLQSPERIDRIARAIGMAPLRPEQVLPSRVPSVTDDIFVIAMVSRR